MGIYKAAFAMLVFLGQFTAAEVNYIELDCSSVQQV